MKPAVPETVHPIQHGITPKRSLLPHSDTENLTYIDDDTSSIRDGYTARVMTGATTPRERHMACKGSAVLAFRKAYGTRNRSPQPKYRFDTSVPNRVLEQTRISILSWNPGPRRGKPGALDNHIAGKGHIIGLQRSDRVSPARVPHEPFLHYPLSRLRRLIQQRHFPLGRVG